MKILIFGGSFNPPHIGHVSALESACGHIKPDLTLVIPAAEPPHKQLSDGSPSAEERMELARLAFGESEDRKISPVELERGGRSYTSDTLRELKNEYPGAELFLLVGTDMLLSMERWHEFEYILENVTLAIALRENGDNSEAKKCADKLERDYGAKVLFVEHKPIDLSSTEIRELLSNRKGCDKLSDAVYSRIIQKRLYNAQPDLDWLREKSEPYLKEQRIPHVRGCAEEAYRLAERWGEDPLLAQEAGTLHDITKKLLLNEQLLLCEKYGIINDNAQKNSEKLLHSKTGAGLARELFGVNDKVYEGIFWHTTGRRGMSLFEKIIYLADYIEPTRDFEGVEPMRELAYRDIDAAMIRGIEMTLEDLGERGIEPDYHTAAALDWLLSCREETVG